MSPGQTTESDDNVDSSTFPQKAVACGLIFFGFAALNALSYLICSDGFSDTDTREVIGFPLIFWSHGGLAGVEYFHTEAALVDLTVATIAAFAAARPIASHVHLSAFTFPRFRLTTLLVGVGIVGIALGAVGVLPRFARVAAGLLLVAGPLLAFAAAWGIARTRFQTSWVKAFAFLVSSFLVVVLASAFSDEEPTWRIGLQLFGYWTPQLWAIVWFQMVTFSSSVDE